MKSLVVGCHPVYLAPKLSTRLEQGSYSRGFDLWLGRNRSVAYVMTRALRNVFLAENTFDSFAWLYSRAVNETLRFVVLLRCCFEPDRELCHPFSWAGAL